MSNIPRPKYAHSFMLDVDISIMLAEQTGIEDRSKTAIVEDAIRDYCYRFKADKLKETDQRDS